MSTIASPRPVAGSLAAGAGSRRDRQLRGITLAVVLGAIAWNPWGLSPFLSLRLVTGPLAVGVGVVIALRRGMRPRRDLTIAAAAVIGAGIVSTAASGSPMVGVLGMPGRHAGLLSLITVLAAGFVGAAVGAATGGRRLTADSLVGAGTALSVIALLQVGGLELPGIEAIGVSGRGTGPAGSAAQLGALLAVCVPITVWRVLQGRAPWIVVALAGQLAALLASQARASWLGALVGTAIVLVSSRAEVRRQLRWFLGAAAALVAAVVAIPALRERALALVEFGGGTGRGRITGWNAALRAIAENPWLGAGPDQTRVVLPGALPRRYESTYGGAEILDRAHNVLLDQLLWTGVVGLAAMAVLGVVWWRQVRRERQDPAVLALLAGGAAFAVHLLLNFPMPELDLTVWFVLGAAGGASLLRIGEHPRTRSNAIPAVAAIVATAVIGVIGVRNLIADREARVAVDAEQRGDLAGAIEGYRAATAAAPEQLVYREMYARALLRTTSAGVAAAGERVRALAPGDPFSIELALRTAVLEAYASGDTERGEQLRRDYEVLVADVPSRVQFRVGLGLAELAAGDAVAALDTVTDASRALPSDPGILRTLAMVEELLGRADAAARHRSIADCLLRTARPGTPEFVRSANRLEVCES